MSTDAGPSFDAGNYQEIIVERMEDAAFVVDEEWTLVFANRRALESADATLEELRGQPILRIADGMIATQNGTERFEEALQSVFDEAAEHRIELALDLSSGDAVGEYLLTPVCQDGEVTGVTVVARDVTERLENEQELEETAARLEALYDDSPDMIDIHDADGTLIDVNRRMCEELGYAADELLGRKVWELDERIDPEEARALWEGMETGDRRRLEGRYSRADGSTFPVAVHIVRLDLTGEDRFLVISRDITERKEREEELRTKTRAIDAAPVGISISDPEQEDNPLVYVNDHYTEITGYAEAEALGRNCRFLQGEQTDPEPVERIREAIDDERPVSVELLNYRKDGAEFWNDVRIAPVEDEDGRVTNYVGFQQDISERKQRERDLEQFAYVASHDLREPLRVVSNYLQLLERRHGDDLEEDAMEYVEYAVGAAERMKSLIQGLLTYSRIERRGDEFASTDLDDVLADALANLEIAIERSDATIETEELPTVQGDADQLVTVFQNLLDNAITYAGDEPPEIEVRVVEQPTTWIVTVADGGLGMDPDSADRAFDLFERLHAEHTEGTGMGLALCQRIVDRHGGTIWIDSEPGEGTDVHFSLPMAHDDR